MSEYLLFPNPRGVSVGDLHWGSGGPVVLPVGRNRSGLPGHRRRPRGSQDGPEEDGRGGQGRPPRRGREPGPSRSGRCGPVRDVSAQSEVRLPPGSPTPLGDLETV